MKALLDAHVDSPRSSLAPMAILALRTACDRCWSRVGRTRRHVAGLPGGLAKDSRTLALAVQLLLLIAIALPVCAEQTEPPPQEVSRPASVAGDARAAHGAGGTGTKLAQHEAWTPLFDGKTLDGWQSANFGGEGQVRIDDARIVFEFGEPLTGIRYERAFPKSDYEVRLEAMRIDGIDFFCALTFPVGDSHCTLITAGWAGAVVGLSCVDGKDASENATNRYMNFDNNRWYRIRVRVSAQRIQAWIDDRMVVDQALQDRKISTRPEVDLCKPLGVAAWQSRAAIRKVEYRRLPSR